MKTNQMLLAPLCLMVCIFWNLEIILKAAVWSCISSIYNFYWDLRSDFYLSLINNGTFG